MKRLGFLLALVICSCMAGTAFAQKAALVIGNGAYTSVTALANPPRDAEKMAAALGRIGYKVTLVKDGDMRAMNNGLRSFLRDADRADSVVVFYAGHGVQVRGRNYLLPVSAQIVDDLDLDTQAISLDKLLELIDSAGPKVKIVILDSCRDNPLTRTLVRGSGTRGLARIDLDAASARGTLIAFSTAPGAVAQDGTGGNSPFTTALLAHIETPGMDIRQMFGQVRADVDKETQGSQTPWVNEAIIGTFVMADAGHQTVPPTAPPVAPPFTLGQVVPPDDAPAGTQLAGLPPPAAPPPVSAPVSPTRSFVPSFPCDGRLNGTEYAICRDADLSALDVTLSAMFSDVNRVLSKDLQGRLRTNQTAWRGQRDQCGADAGCIGEMYRQRIAFLRGMDARKLPGQRIRPGFPCNGRLNATERAICGNNDLARLDNALNAAYKSRVDALSPQMRSSFATNQAAWRDQRDQCFEAVDCIRDAYLARLYALQVTAN